MDVINASRFVNNASRFVNNTLYLNGPIALCEVFIKDFGIHAILLSDTHHQKEHFCDPNKPNVLSILDLIKAFKRHGGITPHVFIELTKGFIDTAIICTVRRDIKEEIHPRDYIAEDIDIHFKLSRHTRERLDRDDLKQLLTEIILRVDEILYDACTDAINNIEGDKVDSAYDLDTIDRDVIKHIKDMMVLDTIDRYNEYKKDVRDSLNKSSIELQENINAYFSKKSQGRKPTDTEIDNLNHDINKFMATLDIEVGIMQYAVVNYDAILKLLTNKHSVFIMGRAHIDSMVSAMYALRRKYTVRINKIEPEFIYDPTIDRYRYSRCLDIGAISWLNPSRPYDD